MSHPGKIPERQREWSSCETAGASLPWVESRVWQSGQCGGGGWRAPTGGQGQTGWRWGLAASHSTGNAQQMVPWNQVGASLLGMRQIWEGGL